MRTLAIATLLSLAVAPAFADTYSDLKSAAKSQAQSQLATKLNLPTAAPADAKAYIISPKDGETVTGPVKVVFGLAGAGVAPAGVQSPNTGHHHLLIDDPKVDLALPLPATDQIKHFGAGQTETSLTLKPGKHTLQLVLGDYKHQAFNPSISSEKITITVK